MGNDFREVYSNEDSQDLRVSMSFQSDEFYF